MQLPYSRYAKKILNKMGKSLTSSENIFLKSYIEEHEIHDQALANLAQAGQIGMIYKGQVFPRVKGLGAMTQRPITQ